MTTDTCWASSAVVAVMISTLLPAQSLADPAANSAKICITHAGASAYAPEHTLAAYRLAIEMKADYIEQDLQLTRDGQLVCIHDASLERTTNAEDAFPDRCRTIEAGGQRRRTWPVVDFTLDEIKQLDVGSWFDPKFKDERVPTLQESIDIARGKLGIYPEIKKSEFLPAGGTNIVAVLHRALVANKLHTAQAQEATPVVVQSFHPEMLKELRELSGGAYRQVQLVWTTQIGELLSDDGLTAVATYAQGIGPIDSMLLADPSRVAAARKRGLMIHTWQLNKDVPPRFATQEAYNEFLLYELGVDGLFCDRPDRFPRRPAR